MEMELLTDGRSFAVAQSAPNYLILVEPAQIPAGDAELIVTVDGESTKFEFAIAELKNDRRLELQDRSPTPAPTTSESVPA